MVKPHHHRSSPRTNASVVDTGSTCPCAEGVLKQYTELRVHVHVAGVLVRILGVIGVIMLSSCAERTAHVGSHSARNVQNALHTRRGRRGHMERQHAERVKRAAHVLHAPVTWFASIFLWFFLLLRLDRRVVRRGGFLVRRRGGVVVAVAAAVVVWDPSPTRPTPPPSWGNLMAPRPTALDAAAAAVAAACTADNPRVGTVAVAAARTAVGTAPGTAEDIAALAAAAGG